jgi:hypothetical protein
LQSHDPPSFVFSLDLLPEEIVGIEEVPEHILLIPLLKKKTPRRNKGPTTNCAVASGIYNTTCGTSPPAAVPNANAA